MLVFFKRIPPDTSQNELSTFIAPVLKGGFFSKRGRIRNIKIMVIKDFERKTLEYHGLVRIEPKTAAARVMKILNGQVINGHKICINEFIIRNWHNDPRGRKNYIAADFSERRKGERRRRRLRMKVESESNF